ncbi:MAG: hypothetical protein J7L15_09400 [Clostridiales bacterium]|nr:hypothetical protein [Clostridiales bacterium]
MKKVKLFLKVMLICISIILVNNSFARRGGGGGGFRSSSSPKSTPKSTPKSISKSTPTKKVSANSKRTTTQPKRTATQQKSFETAKKNGTSFDSKADAQKAFKTQHASQYTSTYKKEPSQRPAHIPQATYVSGQSRNVVYRNNGYYYQNSVGGWLMYDAMSDVVMMNALMRHNNYYYESRTNVNHKVEDDRPTWQMYRYNKKMDKQNSKHKKIVAEYKEGISKAKLDSKNTKSYQSKLDKENVEHTRVVADIQADYPKAMRYIAKQKAKKLAKRQEEIQAEEMAKALKRLADLSPPKTETTSTK